MPLCLLLLLPPLARAGSIELTSGKTLTGAVAAAGADLLSAGNQTVKLDAASRITFADPERSLHGLTAEYFGNPYFAAPSVSHFESSLNFHWTSNPANPAHKDRNFSLRLTGTLQPLFSEDYYFYLNATDNTRLFIDNHMIVDASPSNQQTRGSLKLIAGHEYPIRIEFANTTNDPHLSVAWSSPSQPRQIIPDTALATPRATFDDGTGLSGEYFSDPDLHDSRGTRIDSTISFDWKDDPFNNVSHDNFSVRWTGFVKPRYSQEYTFYTRTDDGCRLWVNDKLVVDAWHAQPATVVPGHILLRANTAYAIRMEYFQAGGEAVAELEWSSPSQLREVVPASRLYPATQPPVPAPQTPHGNAVPAPGDAAYAAPTAGIVLRDGSLIAGRPTGLLGKTLKFTTPWRKDLTSLSKDDIAYFFVRPLSDTQRAQLAQPTPQAILVSGDSVEGELADWTDNNIRLSSVVFGLTTVNVNDDLAAISIDPPRSPAAANPTPYAVRLRDGSILHVSNVHLTATTLTADDAILGPLAIPLTALIDLTHTTK